MLYPAPTRVPVTTFKAPEGWITFYDQDAYKAAGFHKKDTLSPLGDYLFMTGFSISETHAYHSPQQSYGSSYNNRTAIAYVGGALNIAALYAQEGRDLSWLDPVQQRRMVVVVEFVAPGSGADGDVADPDGLLREILVISDVVYTGSKVSSPESGPVGYSLDFSSGKVDRDEPRTPEMAE